MLRVWANANAQLPLLLRVELLLMQPELLLLTMPLQTFSWRPDGILRAARTCFIAGLSISRSFERDLHILVYRLSAIAMSARTTRMLARKG